jgi:cobalt-zinc-cadmium efflux system membrane fusion protein
MKTKQLWLMVFLCAAPSCGTSVAQPASVAQPPNGEVWLTHQQIVEAKLTIEPIAYRVTGNEIVTSGKVAFDDLRVAHVFSPVTGRVTRILADPGQHVRRGTPLVVIESPDVGNAFADLGKAQADLVAAQHDVHRQADLYEAHAGAERDLEVAQDNFSKAKAEVERARQKARLLKSGGANSVTQEFTLRAPIDGEVVARNVNPGAEVQGQYSGGAAVELFTVGELDHLWVFADVFEMDLARVKNGAVVGVRVIAYPDRTFSGTVDWIAESLDPVARTARVRCSIANTDLALKPEMYATVTIGVSGTSVPALPRAAVLRIADQTIVFIADGHAPDGRQRFIRRIVAINEDEGVDMVPIVHGATPGEQVVTGGSILLSGML